MFQQRLWILEPCLDVNSQPGGMERSVGNYFVQSNYLLCHPAELSSKLGSHQHSLHVDGPPLHRQVVAWPDSQAEARAWPWRVSRGQPKNPHQQECQALEWCQEAPECQGLQPE